MGRKDDEPNQWINRVAFTVAALATIAAISNSREIKRRLESAGRRLTRLYKQTKGNLPETPFVETIIRTQDPEKAELEFVKFINQDLGSKRFGIRPEDVAFMVSSPRVQILAAETMTFPKTPDLSPIHTFEIDWEESETEYYAVRLTPKQFDPPKI